MKIAYRARNLNFSYNGIRIIDNINLDIIDGEFLSLLGPNGAGKTTLIKILTGVIKDISGEVYLYSNPIHRYRRREFARFVSFLPQNPEINLPFRVKDIVMMGRFPYLKRFEMERPEDIKAVDAAMKMLNVDHLEKRHLMELSGGEIKRVFIAQAIAQESKILFLDEPTANLDINYQIEIFRMLKDFNSRLKKTIILITHDINHAARFAHRIVLMKDGRIVSSGTADEVINRDNLERIFNTSLKIEYDSENKPYILI